MTAGNRTLPTRGRFALVVAIRSWLAALPWWVAEFSGASAYDKYVARHRLEHPDHEPMSARAFWRMRDAEAEKKVQAGCC